jgi:Glycosyl transferase family 2
MSPKFEVRIPTYNRPDLLRRALESLQAQNYPHWSAMVYDDSSSSDAQEVIRGIADDRIGYQRNAPRLGAAANIDQCFLPIAKSAGDYGCLLEDDNFWLPEFLSRIAAHVENRLWSLVLANQRVWSQEKGLHPATDTTRGRWFSLGHIDPIYLRASTLFIQGVSNGGLVWRLDGSCNLQVGPCVQHAGLQEVCRSLLVKSPFLFVDEALAVYTSMSKEDTARANENNRLFGRGLQSIRRFIIKHSGRAVIKAATEAAEKLSLSSTLFELLAHSGYPRLTGSIAQDRVVLKAFLKGAALRLVQADPCSAFFDTTAPRTV